MSFLLKIRTKKEFSIFSIQKSCFSQLGNLKKIFSWIGFTLRYIFMIVLLLTKKNNSFSLIKKTFEEVAIKYILPITKEVGIPIQKLIIRTGYGRIKIIMRIYQPVKHNSFRHIMYYYTFVYFSQWCSQLFSYEYRFWKYFCVFYRAIMS